MRKLFLSLLFVVGCYAPRTVIPASEPYPVVVLNLCNEGKGSGVLANGVVYTAAHVVKDCDLALVYNNDLDFGFMSLVVDRNDWDVAVLLPPDNAPEPRLVELGEPTVGEACTHVSFPHNQVKCGNIVSVENKEWGLRLDFRVDPGNSGSPIYQNGKLVGIVAARWPWRGSPITKE